MSVRNLDKLFEPRSGGEAFDANAGVFLYQPAAHAKGKDRGQGNHRMPGATDPAADHDARAGFAGPSVGRGFAGGHFLLKALHGGITGWNRS